MTDVKFDVFGDALRHQAATFGSKVAFADPVRQVTFAAFNERVNRLVDALTQRGLKRGDRIALLGRNSISLVECIATAKAGFIPVPLNWRLAPAELLALLGDCAPSALVCDEHWIDVASSAFLPTLSVPLKLAIDVRREGWLDFEEVVQTGRAVEPATVPAPDDTAVLIYTSGTTGNPKAAMISHRGLIENGLTSARLAIGVDESDTILCVMPMFHVGGLCYYLLPSFMAGSTSILRPAFDLADLVDSLRKFEITNVHLVPTMISDLVAHPGVAAAAGKLKRIVYAGSTMPVALLELAMSVFGSCSFSQSYGSTEGGIVSTLGPEEHAKAAASPEHAHLLQSCGRPIGECDVRIARDDGTDAGDGEPGEVLVRSPRTMAGYWNLPDKTAAAFDDRYLRTGDIGRQDAQGYLYLIDRKNDMVVTGGENVFPSEVEQVLYRSPDVAEAAVFGVPDARWIEKVVAAVVLRAGSSATAEEVIGFTRQHLAAYKCPKTVFIVNDLPRTGVGKVSRKLLRTRFGGTDMPPSG
jgi:acyl-CoA synthetase (AMP-forming)/AMP-acid ligase II